MRSRPLKLLQVGALNSQKRQYLSIQLIRKLIDNGIDAKLTLVGEGEDLEKLSELSKMLKISDKVSFARYVSNKKVAKFYKDTDVVIMPGVGETFSIVPFEALKFGKISIVTKETGLYEVLSDVCIFVDSSLNGFYKAVVEFSENRKSYTKKIKSGQAILKKFTWKKYAEKFVEVVAEEVSPSVYDEKYFRTHLISPKTDALYDERQTRINRGIDLLKVKRGEKVLDLGCGNGEVSSRLVALGARVWGVDYSPDAIKIAKRDKIKANFTVGRVSDLPYKDDFFDKIVCLDVFEHIYPVELEVVLEEMVRVTRKGGRVVIATAPNSYYLAPAEFLAKFFMGVKKFESNEYHINVFNFFRFKKLFENIKGRKRVFMTNDGHSYFYSRISENRKIPGPIKLIAKTIDWLFENSLSEKIILKTPLKIFFAHDLWAVLDLNK